MMADGVHVAAVLGQRGRAGRAFADGFPEVRHHREDLAAAVVAFEARAFVFGDHDRRAPEAHAPEHLEHDPDLIRVDDRPVELNMSVVSRALERPFLASGAPESPLHGSHTQIIATAGPGCAVFVEADLGDLGHAGTANELGATKPKIERPNMPVWDAGTPFRHPPTPPRLSPRATVWELKKKKFE